MLLNMLGNQGQKNHCPQGVASSSGAGTRAPHGQPLGLTPAYAAERQAALTTLQLTRHCTSAPALPPELPRSEGGLCHPPVILAQSTVSGLDFFPLDPHGLSVFSVQSLLRQPRLSSFMSTVPGQALIISPPSAVLVTLL